MSLSQLLTSQLGWGFHTLRAGIDQEDLRFRPRVIRGVEIWTDFRSGDANLSSPATAGPRRCPEGQLSTRAGSMSPSQSATSQLGWDFHTLRGSIDLGICVFIPGLLELIRC